MVLDVHVGNVVVLKTDYRDITSPKGLMGIVFQLAGPDSSSIAVVTVAGVITFGTNKKLLYVPAEKYKVWKDPVVMVPELEKIRASVLDKTFDVDAQPRVTPMCAHAQIHGHSQGGKLKCGCKTKKCTTCKCAKANLPCTSACACNGSCGNPSNMDE